MPFNMKYIESNRLHRSKEKYMAPGEVPEISILGCAIYLEPRHEGHFLF